ALWHRRPASVWLPSVSEHLQAPAGPDASRFLESLLLLLQGAAGRVLLLPDLSQSLQRAAAIADLRRHDGSRRRRESLLPPHAGLSTYFCDLSRRGRIAYRQPRALLGPARSRHFRLHAPGKGAPR